MKLQFVNGTSVQRSACRTAAENLLHLPMDALPLIHRVEFTPDPLPTSHNEFAVTTYEYGGLEALTKIASVAPAWPQPWTGVKFLQEVYAHELGHAVFAAIPHAFRLQVAALFGAATDSLAVLQPEASPWEDRIIEKIAETFKTAFLPQRLRRYADRTEHSLSLSRYPEFRRLIREGVAAINTADLLEDQMDTLPEVDQLDVGPRLSTNTEEPPPEAQLDPPWEEWIPAEAIGWAMATQGNPNVEYRTVPNTSLIPNRLPREIAAVWTDELLGSDGVGIGVMVFQRSALARAVVGPVSDDGEVQVFIASADRESGYKLAATRTEFLGGENYRWLLTLERWDDGVPTVLKEGALTTESPSIADLGLSLLDGVLTAWADVPHKAVFQVSDSTYTQGYGGIGVIRDEGSLGVSEPGLNNFRVGQLVGAGVPIQIPTGEVVPGGARAGARRSDHGIVGRRG